MRHVILCILLFAGAITSLPAHELFMSDSLGQSTDKLSSLLKNNDYLAKTQFLNSFYAPTLLGGLKSNTDDLKLDSIVVNEWSDELNRIEKSMLYTCTFDDEGKSVYVDIKKWDSANSTWGNGSHNYYWFDETGRLKQVEFQEYVSAEYRFYIRIDYVYENGLLKYENKYDRIDEIEIWDEVEQLEYVYLDNDLLKKVYTSEWDIYEVAWIPKNYRTYDYDSKGLLKLETGFDYCFTANLSVKKFELIYTYDSLMHLQEVVEYIPGWEAGPFVAERKITNTYDGLSKLESETFYKWDYDANDWFGEVKWLYENEPNGAVLWELNNYRWVRENSKWESSYKSDYISGNLYSTSAIANWDFLQTYLPVYAFDAIVCDRIETQNMQNDSWETIGFSTYHFSDDAVVGVHDTYQSTVRIYPNPVAEVLYVDTNSFAEMTCTITNLDGQVVVKDMVENQKGISLHSLSAGFYFVEINSENRTIFTQKIVKN